MRVRLTRKLAEMIDGVDLAHFDVGDVIDLPEREACLLIAEQWAVLMDVPGTRTARPRRGHAADRPSRRARKRRT